MATPKQKVTGNIEKALERAQPRSLEMARKGIRTGTDFANLMAALIGDVVEGSVTPVVANAACNAGGKLLKVVEMQYRHGKAAAGSDEKILTLAN